MFKLATPISHLFENEEHARAIAALSDCLECREETVNCALPKQVLFHFEGDLGHPWDDRGKDFIRQALQSKPELKLISFHLCSSCSDPVLKDGMYQPGGKDFTRKAMLDHARANADWLKSLIGSRTMTIAVENNNYYPTPAYRYVTDADFIREVVVGNGLKFLFDWAHARITTYNNDGSYEHYLRGLPMERMVQIHISQYAVNELGIAFDAHTLPHEDTYQEIEKIIDQFSPEYVTVEYYRDKDQLLGILKRCQQWRQGITV